MSNGLRERGRTSNAHNTGFCTSKPTLADGIGFLIEWFSCRARGTSWNHLARLYGKKYEVARASGLTARSGGRHCYSFFASSASCVLYARMTSLNTCGSVDARERALHLRVSEMRPNPALHTDAPGLSRPLQLARKGRASPRRAGKRER
jgi:hypothetical protein